MANVKSLSLLVVLLMFTIAAPITAAMEIDNIKNSKNIPAGGSFNLNGKAIEHNPIWNNYAPIEIKNLFGLGKTLFQGAITQHDEVCGQDCSSTMQIYLGEDSVLIDDVDFYTIKSDGSRVKQDVRSYQFYVSSVDTDDSTNVIDDTPYSIGTEMSSGTYEVRLEAEKKPSRTVDWVIETQGEVLNEWAVWDGINYVYDDYDSSINSSLWSYQLIDGGAGATTTITETNDYILLNNPNPNCNGPGCGYHEGYLNTTNTTGLLSLDVIDEVKVRVVVAKDSTQSEAYNKFIVFGTIILENANDDSNWTIKANYTCEDCFDILDDDVFQETIQATDNLIRGWTKISERGGDLKSTASFTLYEINITRPNIILNSPANNYISPTNEIELNCSAEVTGGATLTNMSLWTNESGSWTSYNEITLFGDYEYLTPFSTGIGSDAWLSVHSFSGSDLINGGLFENQSFVWSSDVLKTCAAEGCGNAGRTRLLVAGVQYVILGPPSSQGVYETFNTSILANWTSSTSFDIQAFRDARNLAGGETSTRNNIFNSINISEYSFSAQRTITGSIDWTCSAGDSDGDSGFAPENRTVLLDTNAPTINITYPITSFDYTYLGQNFSLNWTVSDTNLEQCWYNYNNINTTVTCTDQNTSFILTNQKNITFYANDSVANEANYTRSWTYKIFENSETYNSTTYETTTEGFKLNLTSDGSQLVLADLVYDGVAYTGTKEGNNSEMEFNRNLIIPAIDISTAQNKSFYWNVTYGSEVIPTEINNQSVERIALGLCNATLTVPYINFTFKDEETAVSTNATIDTSTWNYYLALGDGSVNKTLLYSTTQTNNSYKFCFTPSDRTLTSELELQYSGTGYPQRRWSTSGSLTNLTSNPILYMLSSVDGTYSVYQVQDTVGNGIPGVAVQAERQFAGVWTLVEQGVTDSAGGFTGWLNPDYDHRIIFTLAGYTTIQVTVRPSSSTYTVVMAGVGTEAVYNSSEEGMSWVVYPDLGKIILPNTTQVFSFNITANYSNLVACKMEIVNNDSVSLGTTTGCNSHGGNLSLSIPLGENKSVRAIYSVNIGEGFFILDADAYWILMVVNIPDRGTLTSFFVHLRDLNEFGSDNNRQEFSRIVFFYLILAIVMASISRATNWDLINIGGSLVFMNFIIIFGSYAGFLTLSYTGINGWMDQYVVALITSLFTVGFIFNKLEGRV